MPAQSVFLNVLVENTVSKEGLRGEHGLSVWFETSEGTVLWDTGQSSLLLENARKMSVDLRKTSCIALSHGHYDHTGGLSAVLTLNPQARVFGHPGAFIERFGRGRDGVRQIGSPVTRDIIRGKCTDLDLSSHPREILPELFLTGEIPRLTEYEDTGGDFFLDAGCTVRDPIPDDQALYFETGRGIVVLLGCAHSGVVNTLNHIEALTGRDRIYGVLGGMHLIHASDQRLAETADAFRKYDVQIIGPCHCTGERARKFFGTLFPGRMVECAAGSRFQFAL
jgi:7,8-dihydropterin-6-yl-methyl-4-(beta-D-ribofuranosyl)aminobenzene 5'-phosphate synthase